MKNKETLTTERKIELEEYILKDPFLNENNRNIDHYLEIEKHFKKSNFTKIERSYLIIASVIPFDEFSLDIELLMNGMYDSYTFMHKMMKRYLLEPKSEKEFNSLKRLLIYRYESVNKINSFNKEKNNTRIRG